MLFTTSADISSVSSKEPRRDSFTDRPSLLAFSIYLALSLALFGLPLWGRFRDYHVGMGTDPSVSMWFLVWWPHALVHRINPFFTNLLWAPDGINLAWTTSIPLPSILAWPITALFGPVAAFNVLCLIGPPLSAWTAFLLCRYVTRSWWPSLMGGYVFGFSAYMLGHQSCGHLSLTLIFLVPLAALAVVRALAGEVTAKRLIALLAAILVAQFLISPEIFATMTLVGAILLFLGYSFAPAAARRPIVSVIAPIACAYLVAALLLSPYIYWLFAFGAPPDAIWPPDDFSADLLNFVVPTPANLLGALPLFDRLSLTFRTSSIAETSVYLGLPLIAILIAYAWREWRAPIGKLLVDTLVICTVFAMGPRLHIRGTVRGDLPGKILFYLPVLDKILPARLAMYTFLLLAIVVSLWFASSRLRREWKIALAVAVLVFTMPNFSPTWAYPAYRPDFFTTGIYRDYLSPDDIVLVMPFGVRGDSMLWHADTTMYFRMAGGWTGPPPLTFSAWPIYESFLIETYLPNPAEQLRAFMASREVSVALVVDHDPDAAMWNQLMSEVSSSTISAGGVTLHRISPDILRPYRDTAALEMKRRESSIAFDTLLAAADRWLAAGNDPAQLTPYRAFTRGWLNANWVVGPTSRPIWVTGGDTRIDQNAQFYCGTFLGQTPTGQIGVGLYGSYDALAPTIGRFRSVAAHIYFPYPRDLLTPEHDQPQADEHNLMVMVFDRAALSSAAERVKSPR